MAAGGEIDAFLCFGRVSPKSKGPKIDGETTDMIEREDVDGWGRSIQVQSYSTNFQLNTANTEETHSQAGAAVAPNFEAQPVQVQKQVDAATPYLLAALSCGTRYEYVYIAQRKAGGTQGMSGNYFWIVELADVLISNLAWQSSDSGPTTETVTLTYYGDVDVKYYRQKATGQLVDNPDHYKVPLKEAMKSKHDKQQKNGADMSESDVQSVVKRVVQAIKSKNPNLNIRA